MLVTVDLCTPAQMRGRLAAFAAIFGAQSRDRRGCFADGPLWHFDDAHCAELISEFAQDASGGKPDPAAVEALIAADADVTVELVTAVIGDKWDAAAGAAAARAFLSVKVA